MNLNLTLIAQALAGSPSLAASQARFDKAMALASASSTATDVHGTFSADATRQRYSANGLVPPPVAGHTYSSSNVQAGLSWSPDFFGRHAAELQAALGQARAAQADSAAAANVLAAQIAQSYVALARLLAQRDIAQQTLIQRQSLLNLSQGCLVHKDLALWNILGTAREIEAFIDFDDAVSGDAMDDLSLLGCFYDGPVLASADADSLTVLYVANGVGLSVFQND